jgi:hypothetical protein
MDGTQWLLNNKIVIVGIENWSYLTITNFLLS